MNRPLFIVDIICTFAIIIALSYTGRKYGTPLWARLTTLVGFLFQTASHGPKVFGIDQENLRWVGFGLIVLGILAIARLGNWKRRPETA